MTRVLTPEQVADHLAVSTKTVLRLCRSGELGFKVMGRWRIDQGELDAFKARHRGTPPAPEKPARARRARPRGSAALDEARSIIRGRAA